MSQYMYPGYSAHPQAQAQKNFGLVVFPGWPPVTPPVTTMTFAELCAALLALYHQNPELLCKVSQLISGHWVQGPVQTIGQALYALNCPR